MKGKNTAGLVPPQRNGMEALFSLFQSDWTHSSFYTELVDGHTRTHRHTHTHTHTDGTILHTELLYVNGEGVRERQFAECVSVHVSVWLCTCLQVQ